MMDDGLSCALLQRRIAQLKHATNTSVEVLRLMFLRVKMIVIASKDTLTLSEESRL